MSIVKTRIDQQLVLSFVEEYFKGSVADLAYIDGGEGSQAFSFSVKGKEYIIRVNIHNGSFLKDKYASEHFESKDVIIPKIVSIGMLDNKYCYALSEKIGGKRMDKFTEEEVIAIMPELLKTLDAIHATDISLTAGYGEWNAEGNAPYKSWKAHIISLENWATGKQGRPNFFETTILERNVWDRVYREIIDLTSFCSEERSLLHGDFGFDNILSDGRAITGVIDWGEGSYGDFLYDCAWLSYWSKSHIYRTILKRHFADKNIIVPNYDERMKCYELHVGLGALGFFAFSQQKEKYEWNKARLLGLLDTHS